MLSADGCVETYAPADIGCCPPPLCGNDLCCTLVAFFNLLPSGPMWDFWKAAAISYFERNDDPAQCPLLQNPKCPSIILHAIYTVLKLRHVVHTGLWPALRESHPATAVTTIDDHLARLRWEDCYAQHCRTVLGNELTPYEIMGICGPIFCAPNFPPELECAVKRNIAIALTRANMGVIKNMCGINWIIEPLGAELKPAPPAPNQDLPLPQDECMSMCAQDVQFILCNTSDTLEGCGNGDICEIGHPLPPVQAYWDRDCDRPAGLPERIWPAVLAAECIVRSMLPPTCPSNITRCC